MDLYILPLQKYMINKKQFNITKINAKGDIIRVDEPEGAYLVHQHDSAGNLVKTDANSGGNYGSQYDGGETNSFGNAVPDWVSKAGTPVAQQVTRRAKYNKISISLYNYLSFMYKDFRLTRIKGHQMYKNSYERHYNVSYALTTRYGPMTVRAAGIVNEIQGFAMHDVPNIVDRITGESDWAFSIDDIFANEAGIQDAINDQEAIREGHLE
jgi:hypothetical protein